MLFEGPGSPFLTAPSLHSLGHIHHVALLLFLKNPSARTAREADAWTQISAPGTVAHERLQAVHDLRKKKKRAASESPEASDPIFFAAQKLMFKTTKRKHIQKQAQKLLRRIDSRD